VCLFEWVFHSVCNKVMNLSNRVRVCVCVCVCAHLQVASFPNQSDYIWKMKLHVEKWFGKGSGNDNTASCFPHEVCWNVSHLIFNAEDRWKKAFALSKRSSAMICSSST